MAQQRVVFIADAREQTGKGGARRLRQQGHIPAIIYGGKQAPQTISTTLKEIVQEYNRGHFTSRVFEIQLDGKNVAVLPRDVQLHPVTDRPVHVDFLRVDKGMRINVMVAVRFRNADKSPGLKRGGVLNIVRRDVELLCDIDAIPKLLEVNLEGVQIGESLHISHIKLPDGVEPVIKGRDFTIATVVGRMQKTEGEGAETGQPGAAGANAEETEEASAKKE